MDAEREMTGGCQCGCVRYRVRVRDDDAYLCHCRMCQRATGGVAAAFKGVQQSDVTWEGEADWRASSAIARRGFCGACGTPIGFAYLADSERMDLTVGSFDDPSRLRPTQHFGAESLHEAWLDTRALPRSRSDDSAELNERWEKAGGRDAG